MHLRIIAIGNKMPKWVNDGYQEYAKRFTSFCSLELLEIPAEKRTANSDINRLILREGEKILAQVKSSHRIIALDVKGKTWSTEELSQVLNKWQLEGRNIDFIIGGPDGLSSPCLEKAELRWSLSSLTLPHPLVRIILAEQLYRAFSLLKGHPYHR